MKRLLTALALIPAVTWVILWANYWVFLSVLIAVALLCYYEYCGIAEGYGFGRLNLMGYGAGVLLLVWQAQSWPLVTGIALVALGAVLRGQSDSVESIAQRMSAYSQKRWRTQPAAPSAGCMFKNPSTIPAGRLIDELGLKGSRVGGARVSQEHGNFLVNDGQATAADVLGLIDFLQARVRAERGIELHPEVEIIGE